MTEPLITRGDMTFGTVRLVDAEVIAEESVGSTVLRGSQVRIAGQWAEDAPFDLLADQWAATPPEREGEVDGARLTSAVDGGVLHMGPLVLRDWEVSVGAAISPDGIIPRGTQVVIHGVLARALSFIEPPPQPEPAPPRRTVKRILRDDAGTIVGIEEVTG